MAHFLRVEVSDLQDNSDYQSLIDHFQRWAKKGSDWEEYRKSIPEELREIWINILRSCNKNGFLCEGISYKDGKTAISWKQIIVWPSQNMYETGKVSVGCYRKEADSKPWEIQVVKE